MRKSSGYTLIEILIALTVIAILFSAGFVGYRDFSRRQALQGAVKIVQGDLRKAQQNALSGIKPTDAKCNSPQRLNGYNFFISSPTTYEIQADCTGGVVTISSAITLPTGINLSIPTPNPILFRVLGLGTNIALNSNAAITFTQDNTNNTATLTIGSGGEIK